jgi:hypothetical protein
MGAFDLFTGPLRSLFGAAERAESDVERHTPTREVARIEAKLEEAVAALHTAADSVERHAAVIEALADSLPPLTESVTHLTNQLQDVIRITAPLAATERELSRMERLFGRRRRSSAPPSGPEPPTASGPATPEPESPTADAPAPTPGERDASPAEKPPSVPRAGGIEEPNSSS